MVLIEFFFIVDEEYFDIWMECGSEDGLFYCVLIFGSDYVIYIKYFDVVMM